jgi:voltage-gated potassium channel
MNRATQRLAFLVLSLAALVAAGTVGFMVLEGMTFVDALFMAVVTLSTVGFSILKPLSTVGKLFTIGLIVVGVATFSYHISQLVKLFVEKGFMEVLEKRRMQRRMEGLSDHYIVCGYGRIGSVVVGELLRRNTTLVVIEQDERSVASLEEAGTLALHADARQEETLRLAGVDRARGLIVLMPDDADNLYVILTARELNPDVAIISRANDPVAERRLKQAGASHVISPHREGGKRIARMILNPNVTDFLEMATEKENLHLQMEEFVVRPQSPLAGKLLSDTGLLRKHRVLVVAIKRVDGTMLFNPEGTTSIQAGDALIVLGPAIRQFDL